MKCLDQTAPWSAAAVGLGVPAFGRALIGRGVHCGRVGSRIDGSVAVRTVAATCVDGRRRRYVVCAASRKEADSSDEAKEKDALCLHHGAAISKTRRRAKPQAWLKTHDTFLAL